MLRSQRRNSGGHGAENSIQISALAGVEPRTLPLDYRAPLLLVASYDMQEATANPEPAGSYTLILARVFSVGSGARISPRVAIECVYCLLNFTADLYEGCVKVSINLQHFCI